nr:hypothetical protein [Tanacetum cinerariifolium]
MQDDTDKEPELFGDDALPRPPGVQRITKSKRSSNSTANEFIKSCVENLIPNPSESEGENECDVPASFTTFSNVLFDDHYDSDSSDDQSLSVEDVREKIYSNPLFDEEIIPIEIDQHSLNAKSDLIESMPNHDSSFAGELTLLKSFPPGIDETDCQPKKEIRFAKRLLYDNSSPRPSKEIVSDNSNVDIEYFSPYHILNKDSASHIEETDLFLNPDDPMSPSIEEDDDDSERDISIFEELPNNYSLSLPANESYHFDIPSPYRPPAKPPDGNAGTFNIKMLGDVSDQKALILLEKWKIASWAPFLDNGDSGGGEGLIPIGFEGFAVEKEEEKGCVGIGRERMNSA